MLKNIAKRAFHAAGIDVRRTKSVPPAEPTFAGNQVVPDIWKRKVYVDLLPSQLVADQKPVVLVGARLEIESLRQSFAQRGFQVRLIEWDWSTEPPPVNAAEVQQIILCRVPVNEAQWKLVRKLKQQFGSQLVGLQEVVLPFTSIRQAQNSLDYYLDSLEEIAPYYLGDDFFGPLDELNRAFPLAGKTVIEFGPMEGAQTAGLIRLGARSVTCIEARAESFIKTMIAKTVFGWDNVRLVMDDFHNADDLKYGKFDLAFAHGVYYHSVAPFFFFENLMSLSDNIFIGGYTLAEPVSGSADNLQTLEYENRQYVARRIPMGESYNTGVNYYGYHFTGSDLQSFFKDRGYRIVPISDEEAGDPWGERFVRFVATRA
jgi:hypothetical protein